MKLLDLLSIPGWLQLSRMLFVVHDFQNGSKFRALWNVSINFLLFYKNNGMLKTDIMLDYW